MREIMTYSQVAEREGENQVFSISRDMKMGPDTLSLSRSGYWYQDSMLAFAGCILERIGDHTYRVLRYREAAPLRKTVIG